MSFAQWMLEMSCKNLLLMGCYCKRGFCNAALLSRSLTPEGGSGLKVHEPQVVRLPTTSCCLSHMDTVQQCVTASEQVHVWFFFPAVHLMFGRGCSIIARWCGDSVGVDFSFFFKPQFLHQMQETLLLTSTCILWQPQGVCVVHFSVAFSFAKSSWRSSRIWR